MKRTKKGGSKGSPRRRGSPKATRAAAKGDGKLRGAHRTGARRRRGGPARAAPRSSPRSLVEPVDLERQLADPIEAAQEDLRALPERPLFDRDDSGRDDDLAELLGEEYVRSVTSGEEQGVELRDEPVPEEEGGPFVETGASKEYGHTPDDAEPEPLPLANRERSRLLR